MKDIKFYTFTERRPKHGDEIAVICGYCVRFGSVVFPSIDHPKKFQEDYFVVWDGYDFEIRFKHNDYYCKANDLYDLWKFGRGAHDDNT